jgi:hypothetical protein
LLWWVAAQALQVLPPPGAGLLYLVGARMLTGQPGAKHPVAHKTRLSQDHPDVFGFRIVLLMAQWDVYRIPVDVVLIRRQDDPDSQTETALFRQMLPELRRPTWGQEVVVTADAAYTSRANLATIQGLRYWYAMALPRGKYTRIRMPTVKTQRRRTFWVYTKRVRLRHLGPVIVVLSKCRRNDGPQQTKIRVTHRPETVTAREVVGVNLQRWWIELPCSPMAGTSQA